MAFLLKRFDVEVMSEEFPLLEASKAGLGVGAPVKGHDVIVRLSKKE